MKDAQQTLYIHTHISSNIHDITRASRVNDAAAFFDRNNRQINQVSQRQLTHQFEDKLVHLLNKYCNADTVIQEDLLKAMNREFDMIERENRRHIEVQDSLEIQENRTFGKRGPRKKTGAELAVARLRNNDKPVRKQTSQKFTDLGACKEQIVQSHLWIFIAA